MKKKGFTLVELLAVLAILAVLALLITPTVFQAIERFKNNSYESQIRSIEVAASDFASDYLVLIPLKDNQVINITLGDLKAEGYVDKDLKNPKTDELFPNDSLIAITRVKNNYSVKFDEKSGTKGKNNDLSEKNAPEITLNGDKIMQIMKGAGYVEPGYVGFVSGVTVAYKKGNAAVTVNDLKNEGIYTVYYTLVRDGITQVITRTVISGDTSSISTPTPSPTPATCSLTSVVGKNENGLAWQGNNLVNSSSVTGEYSSAGTNTMFKGNFPAGKSIRIYFTSVNGYTISPGMQKNIILDDGTTVPVQSNTSGPTMAYIDFTLPKTVSQFNYPLYFNGSGGAIGTAILKTSMQCS